MFRFTNETLRARKYRSLLHCTWALGRKISTLYPCPCFVPVGRPHLVGSPRFIPESVFHTQSAKLSLHFIPQSVFYTQFIV